MRDCQSSQEESRRTGGGFEQTYINTQECHLIHKIQYSSTRIQYSSTRIRGSTPLMYAQQGNSKALGIGISQGEKSKLIYSQKLDTL